MHIAFTLTLFIEDEVIIVQDFSKFYTVTGKVSDLVVVVYTKGEALCQQYLDYFSTEGQDFILCKQCGRTCLAMPMW